MSTVFCRLKGSSLRNYFELEGKFDRQMDDLYPVDAGTYALRMRLGKWFGNGGRAQELFKQNSGFLNLDGKKSPPCPYGINIPRKIKIASAKLSGRELGKI